MILYMAVTPDKYELPIMVEDSLDGLARKTGMKKSNIKSNIAHGYSGKKNGMKLVRVNVD